MTVKHLGEAAVPDTLAALPERGLRYAIVREGRDVAALVSVADLWRLEQHYPDREAPDTISALVGILGGLPADVAEEFLAHVRAEPGGLSRPESTCSAPTR